ncbi:MAG: gamma-glutamyltransferase [Armatimonadaceae bacterium]
MHGMVASDNALASQAGVEILKRGGNAIDAAVAVGLALAVTHPQAGNIGGGGFLVYRRADGQTFVIDYRETAPAKATRTMYQNNAGEVIPEASTVGYRASGVPGTVAGLALAREKHGTMAWRDLVEPARKLAADGFLLTHTSAEDLKDSKILARFPETRRIFQRSGRYYTEGERFRQPDLAATLRRLQEKGPREFYEGETARRIADDMAAHSGLITLDDLKAYRPVERQPLRGMYRGYEIITMPPPSSGGIALLQMLGMLERHDLRALGFGSSRSTHLLIEAMRRAFADRAVYLGDPDFVSVPVAGLLDTGYIAARAATINPERATPSAEVGAGKPAGYESTDTTHFCVVDKDGNAVSNTYTLNFSYGSGVTIRGTGILMNNEMDDFAAKPGTPNGFGLIQGESNAIAPRKRPLSSMTPTIVAKEGKLFAVVGSPGGPRIINTVLQVLVNVIDHRMNIRQAVEAPRLHHQWMPDRVVYERFALSADAKNALQQKGHTFADSPTGIGLAQGIVVDAETGLRTGYSDPRWSNGAAVGY